MIISNYYQPIVDDNLNVIGFEVLLRGHSNGLLMSGAICLSEILKSNRMLEVTMTQISECVSLLDHIPNVFFSINITDDFLENSNIITFLKRIEPQKRKFIHFEIVESITIKNNTKYIQKIIAIKSLGFLFSIDDFFSHENVLSYLIELDINSIKIDIQIVNLFKHNKTIEHMLRTIVFFCLISGGYSIAEGVEDIDTFYELRGVGVSFFQGFLFSGAISYDNLIEKYNDKSQWIIKI